MKTIRLILLILFPLTGNAHHWIAGDYGLDPQDRYGDDAVVEYEGEVLRVLWSNPHPRIRLEDAETGDTLFFEAGGLGVPERRGLSRDIIKVGDHIKISALSPSLRRGSRHLILSVLLADRRELMLLGTAEPRWSNESIGTLRNNDSSLAVDQSRIDESTAQANGIYRVWTKAGSSITWTSDLPLTDAAVAARESFDLDRDYPLMRCESPGMPRAVIGNSWPIEFEAGDGVIINKIEEFDLVRTIHMDDEADPDNQPATPLGYSVGRWDNSTTLVVNTTRIDWSFFDDSGLPQSEAMEISERFTLGDNDTRLDYEIRITDQGLFTEPVTGTKSYTWIPGQEVRTYECVADE